MAFRLGLIGTLLFYSSFLAWCQPIDTLDRTEKIVVTGRPSKDSITLRWAPVDLSTWQKGNRFGYTIERFLMVQNGSLLTIPTRTVLNQIPLKPASEARWKEMVEDDKFAAIAAQALFGDDFEVDLSESDVMSIVNTVRENEQRYSFALFCADMSPAVARASGLWFSDTSVVSGEKYLYRITIKSTVDSTQVWRGSFFISPDDAYALPKPMNLKADFEEHVVSLKWNKSIRGLYSAYVVERSIDGQNFVPISDEPIVTVSPSANQDIRYEYATDSLKNSASTIYYRVKGITSFGEQSPPSDLVSGKSNVSVSSVPNIKTGENINNTSIALTWDFPVNNNEAIRGFWVERSSKPKGTFSNITIQTPLPPNTRSFEDKAPGQINYYRVTALGTDGNSYSSPLYFAHLIDSIPPSAPVGLKASVNEFGVIDISWEPNTEHDIYGYRIYKSNYELEEAFQITNAPITDAFYRDKADLNTLNEHVYYMAMAIDQNQNHSVPSALLKVSLPDKLKPVPPVFMPIKSHEDGVRLSWVRSSSSDVVEYNIYRQARGDREWRRIKIITAGLDTVYHYTDAILQAGGDYNYTVTAIDDAQLESDPSQPVAASHIQRKIKNSIVWKNPVIQKENGQVSLAWQVSNSGVKRFRIYKAEVGKPPILYKSISGEILEFTDKLLVGRTYSYRILAEFQDQTTSTLSEEMVIEF